jgi:hypothetical protein
MCYCESRRLGGGSRSRLGGGSRSRLGGGSRSRLGGGKMLKLDEMGKLALHQGQLSTDSDLRARRIKLEHAMDNWGALHIKLSAAEMLKLHEMVKLALHQGRPALKGLICER